MTSFKTRTGKHPLSLFWMLMPALAVNELLFGQRVPQKMLVEKDRKKPLAQRTYVRCPHCQTVHPFLKWSLKNKTGLGNWFGLYCDQCGGIIPCLWNVCSLLILTVTFPIWIWLYQPLKRKWRSRQKERFTRALDLETPGYNWPLHGIFWGSWMFLIMGLFFPWATGELMNWKRLLFTFLWWHAGGLIYGYILKLFADYQEKKKDKKAQENASRSGTLSS